MLPPPCLVSFLYWPHPYYMSRSLSVCTCLYVFYTCVHVLMDLFVWCTGEEGTEVTLSFAKPADFDFKAPASLESLRSRGRKKVDRWLQLELFS